MKHLSIFFLATIVCLTGASQYMSTIDSFRLYGDVKISIDRPSHFPLSQKTIICFFALPNGNTTEQTMGKKLEPGDDWHYDIQHIKAQTAFIRKAMRNQNFVVVYLENNYKSWPTWKQKHSDFKSMIPHLIDSLTNTIKGKKKEIYLNGHSGGGSFIFGYMAGVEIIQKQVSRISFLDSDYGYDSSYYPKIKNWLVANNKSTLTVFAYNDSIVIYNGKPLVSATGGTWYRSHLMLAHLQKDFSFNQSNADSLIMYRSTDNRIQFYFKVNVDGGIYHTQQVELNGFIHSVLAGTKQESKKYSYYTARAYTRFIE
jgi:hypothetical protein